MQGRLYLMSWLAFLVGIALFSAQAMDWLPNNLWTHNSIIYGSTLEMIVLFFTLAQKITLLNKENNITRQEMFKTQNQLQDTLRTNDRELFKIVKKRTTTLEKANEYLISQHGKVHDTLTGLANADLINEQLRLLLAECKRKDTKLVVLLLNLDNFKEVNTKFGHEIGDKLLINIAAKIRDNLRESDVAARTAGDEFIILLEVSNTEKDPALISRKLKKAIDQTTLIDGYAIQIAVSIGVAIYPDNGDDVEDLLSKATQAMYVDKGYVKSSTGAVTP
ncbi:MAG: GGDEF domain-containing protein [Pseudomonadota bacterium]|nr:GGDEF domain-containing protein [Pseudomonadota bacterium]